MRTPFDPLFFLERELRLRVFLGSKGNISVHGLEELSPKRQTKARKIIDIYNDLLLLQLDAPDRGMRPSVRKLMAQGKIAICEGKYVVPG